MNNPNSPTEINPSTNPVIEPNEPSEAKPGTVETPEVDPVREASPNDEPTTPGINGVDPTAQ